MAKMKKTPQKALTDQPNPFVVMIDPPSQDDARAEAHFLKLKHWQSTRAPEHVIQDILKKLCS